MIVRARLPATLTGAVAARHRPYRERRHGRARWSWAAALLFAIALAAQQGEAHPAKDVAQGRFVSVRGRDLIAPDGRVLLLKGINLGGWLIPEGYMLGFAKAKAPWQIEQLIKELVGSEANNAFWRRWRDGFITRDDIRYIRSTGMNVIRVPLDYRLFTPEDYPGIWVERAFEPLDRIVDWSARTGLFVILEMHAAPCGQTGTHIDDSHGYPHLFTDAACRSRTVKIWSRIAEHYAHSRTVIGYDLLNEPIAESEEFGRFNPMLEGLYKKIAAAIARVDANHLLFLSGAQWSHNLDVFKHVHFAPNLVYTFHMYWMNPTDDELKKYIAFSKKNNVPIFLGESGENTDHWIDSFRQTVERHRIGWAFWTYKRMDTTNSMRSFDKPPNWDELIAYQESWANPRSEERGVRPPVEHVLAALKGLVLNAGFQHSRENDGYVRALGLKP
jgi:hypothetical protein